jgi:hypothetical protein
MMHRYEIHTLKDDQDMFFWGVWEKESEQAIDFFYFKEDADKCAKFMENGGAFAGFTPSFMLRECKTGKDLNQEFNKLVTD